MELIELKNKIIQSFADNSHDLTVALQLFEEDVSVFPFNKYEHLLCNLISKNGLTFQQYLDIRSGYILANSNLRIFEISSPRGFGEDFAQTHVRAKSSQLIKPTKKLDPNYSGQYDLLLGDITIEVKASRAVDADSTEPLYMKALARQSKKNFLMNFQQLKPQCCDVFIWVAVFRDEIVLWVISSSEVPKITGFSPGQHAGNFGNEGQMHIKHDNIHLLAKYELKDGNIESAINRAALITRKTP